MASCWGEVLTCILDEKKASVPLLTLPDETPCFRKTVCVLVFSGTHLQA